MRIFHLVAFACACVFSWLVLTEGHPAAQVSASIDYPAPGPLRITSSSLKGKRLSGIDRHLNSDRLLTRNKRQSIFGFGNGIFSTICSQISQFFLNFCQQIQKFLFGGHGSSSGGNNGLDNRGGGGDTTSTTSTTPSSTEETTPESNSNGSSSTEDLSSSSESSSETSPSSSESSSESSSSSSSESSSTDQNSTDTPTTTPAL